MSLSVVQRLFDESFGCCTPVKSRSEFSERTFCDSPMSEFFSRTSILFDSRVSLDNTMSASSSPLDGADPQTSDQVQITNLTGDFKDSGLSYDISLSMMSSPVKCLQYDSDIGEEPLKTAEMPEALCTLLNAPVINKSSHSSRMTKIRATRRSLKRRSPDKDYDSTPVLKRRRPLCVFERSQSLELPTVSKISLQRCHSETETIKSALDKVAEDANIISDGSKTFCLPMVPGKHQDLKSITPETMVKVLNHEYDHVIEQFVIVDCRYNYEYEGGHTQGAENYYTKDSVMENLINTPICATDKQKRIVLIFHCEFSSERGPKMMRFLRAMDRECNKECYPELFYPEVYLLHGGYKNFFEHQKEMCTEKRKCLITCACLCELSK